MRTTDPVEFGLQKSGKKYQVSRFFFNCPVLSYGVIWGHVVMTYAILF